MDWKDALLYVLFCLLAIMMMFCGLLFYMFWRRDKERHLPTAPTSSSTPLPEESLEPAVPVPEPSDRQRLWNRTPDNMSESSRPLWQKLCRLMDEDEVWRNPELTLDQLAAMAGSNRTRIGTLVQEAGYEGYKDFINRRRLDALLDLLDAGQVTAIRDAYLNVGYQSKMTVLRHFKTYLGMTPSEYLQQARNKPR